MKNYKINKQNGSMRKKKIIPREFIKLQNQGRSDCVIYFNMSLKLKKKRQKKDKKKNKKQKHKQN